MGRALKIARRTFLFGIAAVAGGVAFGYYQYKKPVHNPLEDDLGANEATFNPYVKISTDGIITVIAPRAEMGQGIMTTLAALVAEELEVGLDQITVQHGLPSSAYYNSGALAEGAPFPVFEHGGKQDAMRAFMGGIGKVMALQFTGGSSSTIDAYEKMRHAGAAARETLKAAAAQKWNLKPEKLGVEGAIITNPLTGEALSYGELAIAASKLAPPETVVLKDKSKWKILGKSQPRLDMRDKVIGAPIFGIDVTLPDMLHGTVKMSPRRGAKMISYDAKAAQAMPGVIKVVEIDCQFGHGLGVIAKDTWTAFKAAAALEVVWGEAPYPTDTAGIFDVLDKALKAGGGTSLRTIGDVDKVLAEAPKDKLIEASYAVPFLAHTAMEPMNATAQFKDGKLEIWSPNQMPTIIRYVVSKIAGISQDHLTLHTTLMGGGFGRRGEVDFTTYATLLAIAADGKPVKVLWTREEDVTHDYYRPGVVAKMMARIGDDGLPVALDATIAAPSTVRSTVSRFLPWMSNAPLGPDKAITDGIFNQPYNIANMRFRGIEVELAVPVGFWRSVGNSHNCFFHEGFMDELAVAGKQDPVAMRLKLMTSQPTALKVVQRVAAMSNWGTDAPNRAKGFAFTLAFGGWVAQVIEVENTPKGIKITKVWCAADVGLALDPDNVKAQVMSGIVYGLSAAMNQEITFSDGMVEQSNFADFDALRVWQTPEFEIEILENSEEMSGVGEIATPGAAPALANAIFALTGKRIRTLPLSKEVSFV